MSRSCRPRSTSSAIAICRQRRGTGALTVGWIGIPLNAHYLTIDRAGAARRVGNAPIELHVVGAPVPAGVRRESPPKVSHGPRTPRSHGSRQFDVGIMPLHDTPWERGKCAYKLLQVMAAGKPVIASPVGANRQVVRHGVNGFLADTTEEWAEALRQLADPALRQRMGAEARKTVEEQYSTAVVTPRLAAILQQGRAVLEARR